MNKKLRPALADKSAKDILGLFSAICGEAADEQLIGPNPCRKLRINFGHRPERTYAITHEIDTLAGRKEPDAGPTTVTDAFTDLRWGELAVHREHNTDSQFVFSGAHGGLHRRSNFRRRDLPSRLGWQQGEGLAAAQRGNALPRSAAHTRDLVDRRWRGAHPAADSPGAQSQGRRRRLLTRHGSDDRADAREAAAAVGTGRRLDVETESEAGV
ncbi:hypothetical protein [Crossiella sp. CA198]|uniref:hypothetical protein n=1 Tax=Crossiella sp. CA198 TaxID=3455607 RepID=UPI003F8D47DD